MLKSSGLLFCLLLRPVAAAIAESDWTQQLELNGGYVIFYNDSTDLSIIKTDGESRQTIFADDFCSEPVIAPDKNKAVFLYPYDFELLSDIMLFDAATESIAALPELDDLAFQHTPMQLVWLNDEILLVIVGYGYGTITRGGDVYYYNFATGANAKILDATAVEIVQVTVAGNQGPDPKSGLLLDLTGPEYGYKAGRYYHTLPRVQTREFLPMEDVRELLRQSGLTVRYEENPQDNAMNRLLCLAGWLLGQHMFPTPQK